MLLLRSDLRRLKAHVLTMGGNGFQRDDFLAEEIDTRLADAMLRLGRKISGRNARLLSMRPNDCHENVLQLLRKNPDWHAWTGLALSQDGCWRVHSWTTNSLGRVIETTAVRVTYFGVEQVLKRGDTW